MMKKIYVFIFLTLGASSLKATLICSYHSTEKVTKTKEPLTINMLTSEEKKIEDAIDKYKEALEKKREMMMKLWKTTTEVEYLMKENRLLRKKIIKHWKETKSLHSVAGLH